MRTAFTTVTVLAAVAFAACDRPAPAGARAHEGGSAVPEAAKAETREEWREVTIPEGTTLPVVLDTPVGSDTSRVEDRVTAHLSGPIFVDEVQVLPEGTTVHGVVTEATRAGKVKGRAQLALRFEEVAPLGSDVLYQMNTSTLNRVAPSEKKKDAAKIGIPSAGGAIVGGIVGGKKGAVIGGAVGAGAGTAVVLSDRGKEVRLGKGASLILRLTEPMTIRVKTSTVPQISS